MSPQSASQAQDNGQASPSAPGQARSKILVVDNGHFYTPFLKKTLEHGGHWVIQASDPDQALSMAAQYQPDLILLDSGVAQQPLEDLLSELLMEQASAAVVVLAREPSIEQAIDAIRLGATDYLPEPLDAQALQRVIESQAALR